MLLRSITLTKTHLRFVATLLLISVVPVTARADLPGNTNYYVAVGGSLMSINDSDINDEDVAANLRVGYSFGSLLGAEMGYYDFGKFRSKERAFSGNAFAGSVVLNVPLAVVDIYGKLGLMWVSTDIDDRSALNAVRDDQDGIEPFAAIGAEWDMGPLNWFGEFSRIDTSHDIGINVLTAGVKIEF